MIHEGIRKNIIENNESRGFCVISGSLYIMRATISDARQGRWITISIAILPHKYGVRKHGKAVLNVSHQAQYC